MGSSSGNYKKLEVWNKDNIKWLLADLIQERDAGLWENHECMCSSVKRATDKLNKRFGSNLTEEKVQSYVLYLKKRWALFRRIIELPSVKWDMATNQVEAPEHLWQKLAQRNRMALSYKKQGEPEYHILELLFADRTEADFSGSVDNLSKIPFPAYDLESDPHYQEWMYGRLGDDTSSNSD